MNHLNKNDLIDIKTLIPNIFLDIRYATTNNFTGKKHYAKPVCFLKTELVKQLQKVQEILNKENLSLKIWDGYRPKSVHSDFTKYCEDTSYVPTISNHSKGICIDLTICTLDGIDLDMPTDFDDFSKKAHSNSADINETQKQNRYKLINLMHKFGFTVSETEWWHFDYFALLDSEILDVLI